MNECSFPSVLQKASLMFYFSLFLNRGPVLVVSLVDFAVPWSYIPVKHELFLMYPLGVLPHLRPRLAYIFGHYGHERSQGGRYHWYHCSAAVAGKLPKPKTQHRSHATTKSVPTRVTLQLPARGAISDGVHTLILPSRSRRASGSF